jgi:hypothetical protein
MIVKEKRTINSLSFINIYIYVVSSVCLLDVLSYNYCTVDACDDYFWNFFFYKDTIKDKD